MQYGEQPMVNTSKSHLPCRPFPSWLMSTRRSSVLSPFCYGPSIGASLSYLKYKRPQKLRGWRC